MNLKVLGVFALLIGLSNCTSIKTRPIPHAEIEEKILRGDGEIIAFLKTVNNAEIEAAKSLMKHFYHHDVKSFAQFMIKEHTKNLEETEHLSEQEGIPAQDSKSIISLRTKMSDELKHLKPLKGAFLDKAYIDAMVNGHREVLLDIDAYLKTVDNAALKDLLEKTRPHVEHHLEMAKEIKKKLS